MLILLIILLLVLGCGGGYYGHSRWGYGGGAGNRAGRKAHSAADWVSDCRRKEAMEEALDACIELPPPKEVP